MSYRRDLAKPFALTLGLAASVVAMASSIGDASAQPATAAAPSLDDELAALIVPGGLTSDEAARRARRASPAVQRELAELEMSIADVAAAELQRVPRVTAEASYTRLSSLDPVELAPGVSFPVVLDVYVARAQVAVPLSDYVVRQPRSIRAARAARRAADASKRATELDVGLEARLAYYEWLRARLHAVVAKRQLAQVQATLAQVRAHAAAQRMTQAELLRVESQEAEAEQALVRAESVVAIREQAVRLHIGAPSDEPLTVGEDVRTAVDTPAVVAIDDLAASARRRRLDVLGLDLAIEASQERRAVARADRLPRLSAFATAEYANPNERVVPATDSFELTWAAGVQLTWSLDETLRAGPASRREAAVASALRSDREQLLRAVRLDILAAQEDVAIAEHAVATSRKGLAAAEEGYRVRQALLAAERATAVELVDAETELSRARIASLDAHIDLRIAIAELDHALGTDDR